MCSNPNPPRITGVQSNPAHAHGIGRPTHTRSWQAGRHSRTHDAHGSGRRTHSAGSHAHTRNQPAGSHSPGQCDDFGRLADLELLGQVHTQRGSRCPNPIVYTTVLHVLYFSLRLYTLANLVHLSYVQWCYFGTGGRAGRTGFVFP